MQEITIRVREKEAETQGEPQIICGNSDYTAAFEFDEEWLPYTRKTAVFRYYQNGLPIHQDVQFSGSRVAIPILHSIDEVEIGVCAGNLRTTTPARVACVRSITDGDAEHDPPALDVYDQLLAYLAGLQGGGVPAGAATAHITGAAGSAGEALTQEG